MRRGSIRLMQIQEIAGRSFHCEAPVQRPARSDCCPNDRVRALRFSPAGDFTCRSLMPLKRSGAEQPIANICAADTLKGWRAFPNTQVLHCVVKRCAGASYPARDYRDPVGFVDDERQSVIVRNTRELDWQRWPI